MNNAFPMYSFFLTCILLLVTLPCKKCYCKSIKNRINDLHESSRWNFFLRFFYEIVLELAIVISLNLLYTSADDGAGWFHFASLSVTYLFGALFIIFFCFLIWLFKIRDNNERATIKSISKYGALYEDLCAKPFATDLVFLFILRRISFVIFAVFW